MDINCKIKTPLSSRKTRKMFCHPVDICILENKRCVDCFIPISNDRWKRFHCNNCELGIDAWEDYKKKPGGGG